MLYKKLKTLRLDKIDQYRTTQTHPVLDLHSPVSSLLNTFCGAPPLIVDKYAGVDDIVFRMQKNQSKYALVRQNHAGVIGLISYADLCSRKVLITCERKGLRRAELNAEDMMIPRENLQGIRYRELESATLGELLHTMQQFDEEFAMIVDEQDQLCGVICIREILQAMKIPPDTNVTAHSFKDIFNIIHNHAELT
jgi:DeoR family transcriptional regulator, catabolite repression regulator